MPGREHFIKSRSMLVLCLVFSLVFPAAGGSPAETTAEYLPEEWNTLSVTRTLPADLLVIYDRLFYPEQFVLLGKLMTLFLRDRGKGYLIEQVDEGFFSVRSRKTIRKGSVLQIQEMHGGVFSFTGILVIKKGFSFSCPVKVESRCYTDGDELRCDTSVAYKAPAVVEAVDKTVFFLTGRTFIAGKVLGFVDNLHAVVETLSRLEPARWEEIVRDRELLSNLVYPITFSPQECAVVEDILQNKNF